MKSGQSLLDYGIIVHGGAGSFTPGPGVSARKRILARSAATGFRILKKLGGPAVDAVEEAIKVLEDSKEFNAGSGCSLSLEGNPSADAAIMTGGLRCGSIGNVSIGRNPISLARKVMEESDHVFLVGDKELLKFLKAINFRTNPLEPSKKRLAQYKDNLSLLKSGKVKAWPRNYKLVRSYITSPKNSSPDKSDTVGAVAIDAGSKICAGVSTGGRWLKLPGRVGDSAIIGAGIYADELSGAVSATGAGEDIIRVCLCKATCDLMKAGADAQSACDGAISMLTDRIGVGVAGVIAVDKHGRFGAARNTEMLQRAFLFDSMQKVHVAVLPEEKDPIRPSFELGDPRLNF